MTKCTVWIQLPSAEIVEEIVLADSVMDLARKLHPLYDWQTCEVLKAWVEKSFEK